MNSNAIPPSASHSEEEGPRDDGEASEWAETDEAVGEEEEDVKEEGGVGEEGWVGEEAWVRENEDKGREKEVSRRDEQL